MTFEEALASPYIHCIVIAAPAELHKRLALQSIVAGKHTYVEKPLALCTDDGEEMIAAAKAAGVSLRFDRSAAE